MIVVACVDNNMGLLFNKRRQSQDKVMRERLLQRCAGCKLWMNAYSFNMFKVQAADPNVNICVAEDFLQQAATGDYCLIENTDPANYIDKIEQIILFCWNRDYPADFYFNVPLQAKPWRLLSSEDFCGTSHEKITEEVYGR